MALSSRPDGWRPMFGQVGPAQRHLERQGVREGDLFLFFGWFCPTRPTPGRNQMHWKVRYAPATERMQTLFGYLEIGEIRSVDDWDEIPEWAQTHPHVSHRDQDRFSGKRNTVYIAADRLSVHPDLPGGGRLVPIVRSFVSLVPRATVTLGPAHRVRHPDDTDRASHLSLKSRTLGY